MSYKHSQPEARIRRALGEMPAGNSGALREPFNKIGLRNGTPARVELDDIAEYLEAMAAFLTREFAVNRAQEVELQGLRSDVASVRRLFGVGAP